MKRLSLYLMAISIGMLICILFLAHTDSFESIVKLFAFMLISAVCMFLLEERNKNNRNDHNDKGGRIYEDLDK